VRPSIGSSVIAVCGTVAALVAVAPASASTALTHSSAATPNHATAFPAAASARPTLVYPHLALPRGEWAQVYSDGIAEVYRAGGTVSEIEHLPLLNPDGGTSPAGYGALELPNKGQLISDLIHGSGAPYAAGDVVVIYQPGVTARSPLVSHVLSRLRVDRTRQVFTGAAQRRMVGMRDAAQRHLGRALLDFPAAVVLHITGSSVATAVSRLRANPGVAYASPDWIVSPTYTPPLSVPPAVLRQARAASAALAARRTGRAARTADTATSAVPTNYALTSSAQSLLNRPGVDAVPAYAALAQYGQQPGQGEIITNVSLGTLDDASAAANPSDPCNFFAAVYGPTTEVINNQRYLDWPSMPLIPTYTASASGVLNPTGETCGDDPTLTEVGLDFSMMAPLPHDQQRPGAVGAGLTDLLGIAPGASYRLVVPSTPGGAVSNVDAAFAAAATQTPRPDVITASLGFAYDQFGFASRYLEEDPMTEAVLASIVGSGIVVCVSGGDGLRTFTNAAVPPSGGAVATDVARTASEVTSLGDVGFSSAVSRVPDSGAIDVGGSTLNDIFAAPPLNPVNADTSYLQAYPATRYTGGRLYASAFGSRVNVSAPGDNVLSFSHPFGGSANAVSVVNEGGTSASAPETAAAAAVVLQVARLTHDHQLTNNPLAVRAFLASSGTDLPAVPQSDTSLNVGPQIDVGHAVELLLAQRGQPATPGVARVAVVQRRQASALGGTIMTATDPTSIALTGRLANAWITIAPDWTGLPQHGVGYQLAATAGPQGLLADTPWARLQPAAILAAAGLPLVSTSSQSVPLTYKAVQDGNVVAQASVTLTFGPTDGTVQSVPAPLVPPVADGPVIPVRYNISNLTGASSPVLVVSHPGRVESASGLFFRPSYTVPLTAPSGTVDIPVSALPGSGIYGIGIQNSPGGWFSTNDSAFAFTRVATAGDAMPQVPTLSAGGAPAGHFLEIPYRGSFQLHYDVRSVPHADGTAAEFSAPGPTSFNLYNTFNNPNGSQRDANGHDTGSVAYVQLTGTEGTATLNGRQIGLDPTVNHVVRVLATSHGHVVGEASGVSTITMDGVRAADGGSVNNGFGVNATGTDGLLTSDQLTANGSTLASVETFNQSTGAVSTDVSSPSDLYGTINGACAGIFANDVGVYDDFNPANQTDTFRVLNPVTTGTAGGTWSPPASLGSIFCAADNQSSAQDAVLSSTGSSLEVTPADFATNSTRTPINISPALASLAIPAIGGFGQNSSQAFVAVTDVANLSAPGTIADVDLNSGQVTTFPGVTTDFFSGLAVNPVANEALAGSFGGFGIYDLASHAGTLVQPGGSTYEHPAAVPGTSDFLVQEVASPDFFGGAPNNNTMSSIILTDQRGIVLHRFEQFNFFNIFLLDMGDYVQASSATSKAFTLGPLGQQLYPFSYNGS